MVDPDSGLILSALLPRRRKGIEKGHPTEKVTAQESLNRVRSGRHLNDLASYVSVGREAPSDCLERRCRIDVVTLQLRWGSTAPLSMSQLTMVDQRAGCAIRIIQNARRVGGLTPPEWRW